MHPRGDRRTRIAMLLHPPLIHPPLRVKHDEENELICDDHLRTSVPGLYAAGGVVCALNQIAVAMGHAAIATTDIHNALSARRRGTRDVLQAGEP